MLSMHGALRDGYALRAKVSEVTLFVASSVFVSTTFAGDDLYRLVGLGPAAGRVVLGIASVVAFAASVALLAADWRGGAARHERAFSHFSDVLELFRGARRSDGTWPEDRISELQSAYWSANSHNVPIPEASFNRLKARHRRKETMSRLLDEYPWCPRFVMAIGLRLRDSRTGWRAIRRLPPGPEREP